MEPERYFLFNMKYLGLWTLLIFVLGYVQDVGAAASNPTSHPTVNVAHDFYTIYEGGTNNVKEGFFHTFRLGEQSVSTGVLRVEIFETDFDAPDTEFVSITLTSVDISEVVYDHCSAGVRNGDSYYTCFRDFNVSRFLEHGDGRLDVAVRGKYATNNYPHDGYLLSVRLSLSELPFPTGEPTGEPSGQPSGEPTGQPTGQPSGEPSGEPTIRPSSRPSSLPTSIPSSRPTSIPSSDPTGQPSGQPSANPTSSAPSSMPTLVPGASHVVWQGGNSTWHSRHHWDGHLIPDETSPVYMDVATDVYITISENVTVANFTIVSGNLLIAQGCYLNITDSFTFSGGAITGQYQNYDASTVTESPPERSLVHVGTRSTFDGGRKTLRFVDLYCQGSASWVSGAIILASAAVHVEPGAVFDIDSTLSNASSPMIMKSDSSYFRYNAFHGTMLNTEAELDSTLLVAGRPAVYDIFSPSALHLNVAAPKKDIVGFRIIDDSDAVAYFEHEVHLNANHSMYAHTITARDADYCADVCSALAWCRSFDLYVADGVCHLSQYRMFDVGGLSSGLLNTNTTDDALYAYTASVVHYDLQLVDRLVLQQSIHRLDIAASETVSMNAQAQPAVTVAFASYPSLLQELNFGTMFMRGTDALSLDGEVHGADLVDAPMQLLGDAYSSAPSMLINSGEVFVSGSEQVKLDVALQVQSGGKLTVHTDTNLLTTQNNRFVAGSSVYLCNNGTLSINTIRSGETIVESGVLLAAEDSSECGTTGASSTLQVGSGNVVVSADSIVGPINVLLYGSSVTVFDSPAFTAADTFSLLVLEDALLYLLNDQSTDIQLMADGLLHVDTDATIFARNLSVSSAGASSVVISGLLSATGLGHQALQGPLPGQSHNISASGGSYGGVGGSGYVDSTPYVSSHELDALMIPLALGSGGGNGYENATGGAGGGHIGIQTTTLAVNGVISSNGAHGTQGGAGGGAGGSIVLNVTGSFSGGYSSNGPNATSGSGLTAFGGDGGFSGGLMAGAGGSGGRIAVYAGNASTFHGYINAAGGFRFSTFEIQTEKAGAGTIYCLFGTHDADADVNALVVSSQQLNNYVSNLYDGAQYDGDFIVSSNDDNLNGANRFGVGDTSSYVDAHSGDHISSDISLVHRGAIVAQNIGAQRGRSLDLHVVNSSPVLLNGPAFELSGIVASGGDAAIHCVNKVAISFENNGVVLTNVKLHMFNATVDSGPDVHVGTDAAVYLYENADLVQSQTLLPGLTSDVSLYSFGDVSIASTGGIHVMNNSICLQAQTLSMMDSAFLGMRGDLIVNITSWTVNTTSTATINGWGDVAGASFILSSHSTLTEVRGSILQVANASWVNYGVVKVQAGAAIMIDGRTDERFSLTNIGSMDLTDALVSTSSPARCWFNNTDAGIVTVNPLATTATAFGLPLNNSGVVVVLPAGVLRVNGGGSGSTQTCEFNITAGGELNFASDALQTTFISDSAAQFFGDGTLTISGGSFVPALDMAQVALMRVEGAGSVIAPLDSAFSALSINGDATLAVAATANCSTQSLNVAGNGTLSVGANASMWVMQQTTLSTGTINGSGSVVLFGSALMMQDSIEELFTVSETAVLNYAVFDFASSAGLLQGGSLDLVRSAALHNYATVNFNTSQVVTYNEALSVYEHRPASTMKIWNGVKSLNVASALDCAELCTRSTLKVTEHQPAQQFSSAQHECAGFEFNEMFSYCRLHLLEETGSTKFDSYNGNVSVFGGIVSDARRGEYAWDLYLKNNGWNKIKPKFTNEASGQLFFKGDTSSTVRNLPFTNLGDVDISAASRLSFEYFKHDTGLISPAIESGFDAVGMNAAHLQGAYGGSGLLELKGDGHVISDSFVAPALSCNISRAVVEISTANSSGLVLTAADRADQPQINISVAALSMHASTMLLQTRLMLTAAGNVSLGEGSLMYSADNVAASDGLGFDCGTELVCGDVRFAVDSLILDEASALNFSHAVISAQVSVEVRDTSSIAATGRGYGTADAPAAQVQYVGLTSFLGSSGGSHGGIGGRGYAPGASAATVDDPEFNGLTYTAFNSFDNSFHWGLPGGSGSSANGEKSSFGGGAISVTTALLLVDGSISANGYSPGNSGAGGGGGGTVACTVESITGSGRIEAGGGTGGRHFPFVTVAHGGGGGRTHCDNRDSFR